MAPLLLWLACSPVAPKPSGDSGAPSTSPTASGTPAGATASGSTPTGTTSAGSTPTGTTPTGGTSTATTPSVFLGAPAVHPPPSPLGPITLGLTVTTSEPTTLELAVQADAETWTLDGHSQSTEHDLALVGLLPDTAHSLIITAITADGSRHTWPDPVAATPPPLPDDVPGYVVTTRDPDRLEPGYTLLAPTKGRPGRKAWMVLVDDLGRIRWLHESESGDVHALWRTQAHRFAYLSGKKGVVEVDDFGAVIRRWQPRDGDPAISTLADVTVMHHDVTELPDGRWALLSIEARGIRSYPSSESDIDAERRDSVVAGDVVVIYDPEANRVDHSWPLFDRLDPQRIAYDGVKGNYWEQFFGRNIRDWSHGNAVAHDPTDGGLVVTLRHQDAVVKLTPTGEVGWILAPNANWREPWASLVLRPTPGTRPPYHPHSGAITPAGTVVLFDNGNHGASAFEPPLPVEDKVSRGVEFAVDPVAGTYTAIAEFAPDVEPALYAGTWGDTDRLPLTGNLLVTFGDLRVPEDEPDPSYTRVYEVAPDGDIVWELTLPVDAAPRKTFRAIRITL
ncbi:MAG: arylsulfate sulfotransferase [Myxococcota bacterium]|jgi:arylsulfate sulfotransferase